MADGFPSLDRRGIWKPAVCEMPISITTTVRGPYSDPFDDRSGTLHYATRLGPRIEDYRGRLPVITASTHWPRWRPRDERPAIAAVHDGRDRAMPHPRGPAHAPRHRHGRAGPGTGTGAAQGGAAPDGGRGRHDRCPRAPDPRGVGDCTSLLPAPRRVRAVADGCAAPLPADEGPSPRGGRSGRTRSRRGGGPPGPHRAARRPRVGCWRTGRLQAAAAGCPVPPAHAASAAAGRRPMARMRSRVASRWRMVGTLLGWPYRGRRGLVPGSEDRTTPRTAPAASGRLVARRDRARSPSHPCVTSTVLFASA